jgi:hypothetical protein
MLQPFSIMADPSDNPYVVDEDPPGLKWALARMALDVRKHLWQVDPGEPQAEGPWWRWIPPKDRNLVGTIYCTPCAWPAIQYVFCFKPLEVPGLGILC